MALQNEIITVTINYRLNVFGFFKPSVLKNGHFGFRDQQLALKWVQQNIEDFGGDPKRVTLAGQSAGNYLFIILFNNNNINTNNNLSL